MEHPLIGRTVRISIPDPWAFADVIGIVLFGVVTEVRSLDREARLIVRLKAAIEWKSRTVRELFGSPRHATRSIDEVACGAVVPFRFSNTLEDEDATDNADPPLSFIGSVRAL